MQGMMVLSTVESEGTGNRVAFSDLYLLGAELEL